MELVAKWRCHGGEQQVRRHASTATGTDMTFAVFVPPQAAERPVPVLWFLSGLTCSHANVMEKGAYQRAAAEFGLMVVCPDTSPRGEEVADAPDWDLGQGAGFYVDATEQPWARHFRMRTYVEQELPALVCSQFPADRNRQGITGHSMGGHGALCAALRNPRGLKSVSALAPIVAPASVPWGQKAFRAYLGEDTAAWAMHDAVALISAGARVERMLVDVGADDPFLERELRPELLAAVCEDAGIGMELNVRPGYDHSYYFVQSFLAEHCAWHAERLNR
jgi:S-formylglutathione hydrolase